MLLHGEAVSVDMALSAELAYGRGLLSAQERLRVLGVMVDLNLPLWHEAANLDLLMKVRGVCDTQGATFEGVQGIALLNDSVNIICMASGKPTDMAVQSSTRAMSALLRLLCNKSAHHLRSCSIAAASSPRMHACPQTSTFPT